MSHIGRNVQDPGSFDCKLHADAERMIIVLLYMESVLIFLLYFKLRPNDKLCSADVLLASLKVCVKLDVHYNYQPYTKTKAYTPVQLLQLEC